jgi:hypothetical protein
MDIRSSKRVRITGPNIKFTGHSHTPQRRCSDSYWSFGPIMNNLLLDIVTCPTDLGNDWGEAGNKHIFFLNVLNVISLSPVAHIHEEISVKK